MHGKANASFSKSNHPAQKKSAKGLSGSGGPPGKKGGSLVGKENPVTRTHKMEMKKGTPKPAGEKSMASLNPLFHPGNKMAKS